MLVFRRLLLQTRLYKPLMVCWHTHYRSWYPMIWCTQASETMTVFIVHFRWIWCLKVSVYHEIKAEKELGCHFRVQRAWQALRAFTASTSTHSLYKHSHPLQTFTAFTSIHRLYEHSQPLRTFTVSVSSHSPCNHSQTLRAFTASTKIHSLREHTYTVIS